MIKIENLGVTFKETEVLDDISLEIGDREFIAFIGDNGSGKTTLMKCLLGLLEPTNGKVILDNDLEIAYVPQTAAFDREFPITVKQVILSGSLRRKMPLFYKYSHSDKKNCKKLMEELGITNLSKRNLNTLSGGQLQKVLIARGLLSKPDILMLDEPTASVDEGMTEEIFETLRHISRERTVILISHDQDRIAKYAESVYKIKDGHLTKIS